MHEQITLGKMYVNDSSQNGGAEEEGVVGVPLPPPQKKTVHFGAFWVT